MAIVTKSGKIALSMVQAGDSQNFWMLPNDYSTSIPAGLYITKQSIDSFKASPSDSNIFMNSSRGIFIRNGSYNQIALQAGATNPSLRLYVPGGTGLEGELSVELTGGTNPVLKLHKIQGVTNTVAATLDIHGLVLGDGGIIAGAPNTSNFVYLSTNDYTSPNTPASEVDIEFINQEQDSLALTTNTNGKAIVSYDTFMLHCENGITAITIEDNSIANVSTFANELNNIYQVSTTSIYTTTNGQYSVYASYDDDSYKITFHITAISTITINGNSSNWRLIAGTQFGVTNAGALYASNVNIDGTIVAKSGRIGAASDGTGGWTITTDKLYNTPSNGTVGVDNSMYLSTVNFYNDSSHPVGGKTITSGTNQGWRLTVGSGFGVTNEGKLYASGATISGDFTANTLSTNSRTGATDGRSGAYINDTGIYFGGYTTTGGVKTNKFYVEGSQLYLGGTEIMTLINDIATAAMTATAYIDDLEDSKGSIKVGKSSTDYVYINSDGMLIVKGGNSIANFGENVVIGPTSTMHLSIASNEISFLKSNIPIASLSVDNSNNIKFGYYSETLGNEKYSYFITDNFSEIGASRNRLESYTENSSYYRKASVGTYASRTFSSCFLTIFLDENLSPAGRLALEYEAYDNESPVSKCSIDVDKILDINNHIIPSVQYGVNDPRQNPPSYSKEGDIYIQY